MVLGDLSPSPLVIDAITAMHDDNASVSKLSRLA
jgi:hypothetical protein